MEENDSSVTDKLLLSGDIKSVPALSHLTSYPPLSFLLNSILVGLNFIKDCNLYVLRDPVYELIKNIFSEVCRALCDISGDLRRRGAKYFSNVASRDDVHLDRVYGKLMVEEMFPYLLFCCDRLYIQGQDTSHKQKTSINNLVLPLHDVDQLIGESPVTEGSRAIKNAFSTASWCIIEECVNIFTQSNML